MLDFLLYSNTNNFPKYDLFVEKNGTISLEVALAGYKKDDLEVLFEHSDLIIKTVDDYKNEDTSNRDYITKGLAKRKFNLAFKIKNSYEISSCSFKDGLLSITLYKPESKKVESRVKIS